MAFWQRSTTNETLQPPVDCEPPFTGRRLFEQGNQTFCLDFWGATQRDVARSATGGGIMRVQSSTSRVSRQISRVSADRNRDLDRKCCRIRQRLGADDERRAVCVPDVLLPEHSQRSVDMWSGLRRHRQHRHGLRERRSSNRSRVHGGRRRRHGNRLRRNSLWPNLERERYQQFGGRAQ